MMRRSTKIGIAIGVFLSAVIGYSLRDILIVFSTKIEKQNENSAIDVLSALRIAAPITQRPQNENNPYRTPDERKEYDGYVSYPVKVPLKLKCPTCAYVTGSGHLLGSKKGSEIDSMDCVIRSNDAPTIGFEDDVGTKTTIRTVDKRSLEIIGKSEKEMLEYNDTSGTSPPIILSVSYPPPIEEEFKITNKLFPHLRLFASTPKKFREILDIYRDRVTSRIGDEWSNGFKTIYFAHDVCDVIHVYGVNDEDFCKHVLAKDPGYVDAPYHYYGNSAQKKNCDFLLKHDQLDSASHAFTKEKIFFRKLMDEWKNLYFHVPEWNNQGR